MLQIAVGCPRDGPKEMKDADLMVGVGVEKTDWSGTFEGIRILSLFSKLLV